MFRVGSGLSVVTIGTLWGCGGPAPVPSPADQGPTRVEMVAVMEAHYTSAIHAHDALIQGDLDAFRAGMAEFEAQPLPPSAPEAWKPLDARLQAAARQASQITDVAGAADGLAAVALACGSCHQSFDGGPVYPVPATREQNEPLKGQMRDHKWASQMLWNGVTGPSDYAWTLGAAELAQTSIFADGKAGEVDSTVLEREATLREQGTTAMATAWLPARATLYAEMLTTCGGCHQQVGVKLPAYERLPPPPG